MNRKQVIYIVALVLLLPAVAQGDESAASPDRDWALRAIASNLNALTWYLYQLVASLAVALGLFGLGVLLESSESGPAQQDRFARQLSLAPRKCFAAGLVAAFAGGGLSVVLLKFPPLKVFGLAAALALALLLVKGLLCQLATAGGAIARRQERLQSIPFHVPLFGTLVYQLIWLFPFVGQAVVAFVTLQGAGAQVLILSSSSDSSQPAISPSDSAEASDEEKPAA